MEVEVKASAVDVARWTVAEGVGCTAGRDIGIDEVGTVRTREGSANG